MAHNKTAPFRWGVLFTGIFIGIVTGLVMALTAAWKLGGNAVIEIFASKDKPVSSQRIPDNAPTAKTGRGKASDKPNDKPSFDFYKVLPEGSNTTAGSNASAENEKTSSPPTKPAEPRTTAIASVTENTSAPPAPATTPTLTVSTKPKDIYWLQVGSFSRQEDADNRKAELALYGWEATIQKGESPGRGVFYRVRVGPYDNAEQTGRIKSELTQRKFDVAVVRQ
ncbi:MAG: SPOR domain-containing protein [Burkholderiales bacterium]|jgi:cell division protein FtsN|nr:SPOR domain-containing protein [Burkholderiales bacterium]